LAYQTAVLSFGAVTKKEYTFKEGAVFMGHHLTLSLEAVAAWPQHMVECP